MDTILLVALVTCESNTLQQNIVTTIYCLITLVEISQ